MAMAGDGSDTPNMTMIRRLRLIIWLQTEKAIKCSLNGRWAQHDLKALPLAENITETCKDTLSPDFFADERPTVQVVECDMLVHAHFLCEQGHKVAVLNMACEDCPGGGLRSGAGAQEENMHRRSDLVRFTEELQDEHYPIARDACLLSTHVTVFRGPEHHGYPFLQSPFHVTFISCAALAYPKLSQAQTHIGGNIADQAQNNAANKTYADAKQENEMRQKN